MVIQNDWWNLIGLGFFHWVKILICLKFGLWSQTDKNINIHTDLSFIYLALISKH